MADPPKVPKHWIVSRYALPEDENGGLGTVADSGPGTAWASDVFATLEEAKTRARELAAENPGSIFVTYEATWFAFTDITPVTIKRVGEAVIA